MPAVAAQAMGRTARGASYGSDSAEREHLFTPQEGQLHPEINKVAQYRTSASADEVLRTMLNRHVLGL